MDVLAFLFSQARRRIGIIVPTVVVSEAHSDTLQITQHPVENGATISDHAYMKPATVTMELGFAGGGSLLDGLDTTKIFDIDTGLSLGESPQVVYQKLQDQQQSRKPLDVITGKRQYKNMLIQSMDVTTDVTKENVLSCKLTLQQVIITETQKVADKANMSGGVSTAGVQNAGTKSPVPVSRVMSPQG
ncbi:hypothetical protein C9426_33225 [Serratia sp. S1B]|nr:hypothetical protein C9426_33225 [Serratia sp. S1B]